MKILIIDDNKSIVEMLERFLKISGHECITTQDGRNGLDIMIREKFDAVILDLAMPEFSGYDVIDSLEKKGNLKEQNIIVLTATSISNDQMDALIKRGVRSGLRKPVSPEILLETISSFHK